MLNKLARRRLTITVAKRKYPVVMEDPLKAFPDCDKIADEVDSTIVISVTKTDNQTYTEVRMPKPRPERGQTPGALVYDVSPFVNDLPFPLPAVQRPLEEIIPAALGDVQEKTRDCDWSDLD